MIKLLIADDHSLIIDGLKTTLSAEDEFEIVATAKNGKQVLEYLQLFGIDVVLMDINMPEVDGVEATAIIKEKHPETKVIALSMYDDALHLNKMIVAGASGYILKSVGKEELVMAIKKVHNGEKHFSSEITLNLIGDHKNTANTFTDAALTERETEILTLVAQGLSNIKIAEKLFISQRTVDTHRTNIMKKIGVNNVAGIIKYAYQNGLL
jgi:DNA-binding NarL/FixJ family response regulator